MQSRLRRDRAPSPGHPGGATAWRSVRNTPRAYPKRPGWLRGGQLSENTSGWRMKVRTRPMGPFAHRREASPMEHMRPLPPFSLSSPPRSHPGRSGYVRCMLHTLRHAVAPLGCPGPGARSRRNLDSIESEPYTSRLCRDRAPSPGHPRGATAWRSVWSTPRAYPERTGWL